MAFAEDDLVGRLRTGKASVEEADKDALWAAIDGGLPAPAAAGPTWAAWWWLPVLFLSLAGGLYVLSQQTDQQAGTEMAIATTTADAEPPAATPAVDEATTTPTAIIPVENSAPATEIRTSHTPLAIQSSSQTLTKLSKHSVNERERAVTQPAALSPRSELAPHPRQRNVQDRVGLDQLPALEELPLVYDRALPFRPVTLVSAPSAPAVDEITKREKWILGADAGAVWMTENFVGASVAETETQLNGATSPGPGQTAGMTVGYRLGKGFALRAGLSFTRTHSLLDYAATFDTTAPHPSFPGRLTKGEGRYRVTHNNHLSWLSAPLQLHYERPLGKLVAGVGVSGQLNYQLSATGKTISPSGFATIVDTDGETDRLHFSYRLEPSLSLPVSRNGKWNIKCSARLERMNFGSSEHSLTERKGWLYGTSIGVIYR